MYDKSLEGEYDWVIRSDCRAMCAVVAAGAEVFWDAGVRGLKLLSKVSAEVIYEIHSYFDGLVAAVIKWPRSFMVGPLKADVGSLSFPDFDYCSESFGLVAAVRFERL